MGLGVGMGARTGLVMGRLVGWAGDGEQAGVSRLARGFTGIQQQMGWGTRLSLSYTGVLGIFFSSDTGQN